ncbi:MAG: hypothetical protein KDI46_05785 [Alphaproteobacteria bacterium]|nr:hypothetical protein [Alphaproteobacteria bacterium]
MFALTNKPGMAAHLYTELICLAGEDGQGVNIMKLLQHIAGVLVETYLVFDNPDQAMQASLKQLAKNLESAPAQGPLDRSLLPQAHIIDQETERGRQAARNIFEDWLDCAFEFHSLILDTTQSVVLSLENEGLRRSASLRLLVEFVHKAMGFEMAAQELCDVVIEQKIAQEGWSLGDCIASLSAVAGRRLALSLNAEACMLFRGTQLPDTLDKISAIMTQEAIRLGVPAGSDWRFGLAANDMPVNAPMELVYGIEPYCTGFFEITHMNDIYDQAVACAKAAGRMLAVAAGGEAPEIEPAIAKPLAMAAMTETYKAVCMNYSVATL